MDSIGNAVFSAIGRAERESGDYDGENGLLYCGNCNTPKETFVNWPDLDTPNGTKQKIVPCICKCRKEKMEKRKQQEEERERKDRISRLRTNSLIETKYRDACYSSFKITEDNKKLFGIMKKYIEDFDVMLEKNQGLLFWGDVGTGKSFTAACIANELIQRERSVIMTSFVKILQDLWDKKIDEQQYIAKFENVSLLVIDDLGAERNTDYALEKVYNVIDSRYRSGKPMILTTNLALNEIMNTTDVRYKRVYDRILEICYPVHAVGKSFRITEAAKRFDEMKQYFSEVEDG